MFYHATIKKHFCDLTQLYSFTGLYIVEKRTQINKQKKSTTSTIHCFHPKQIKKLKKKSLKIFKRKYKKNSQKQLCQKQGTNCKLEEKS